MTMASQPFADFETQWRNAIRAIKTLQKTAVANGSVVVTNPNANASSPTVPVAVQPPDGSSAGIDPLTGQPLPGVAPIIIAQGVLPVTDLVVVPGAYFSDVYATVTWETSPYSNAIQYEVLWGPLNAQGEVSLAGSQFVSGNSFTIHSLLPNTQYGVQVVASNILGQALSTPSNGYFIFETTQDVTIPPPVSENGAVTLATGATTVIVEFQPLTSEQAPDVAHGNGVYLVEITNDPTWTTITEQVYTSAWIVSFNDIYPTTELAQSISASAGAGTSVTFTDLSKVTPGNQFELLIDSEYIIFNAPTGNTAVIAQRNAGISSLANGPQAHAQGATATFYTQTTWYARVAPIDASGNQGAWTYSTGMNAGGVTDSMLVGDLNAARLTFGVMQGNRIEVNSLSAAAIQTSSLTVQTITLAGGQFVAGNPPATGVVINSQGITLYQNGAQTCFLSAISGTPSLNGATIVGGTIQTVTGNIKITGNTFTVYDSLGNPRLVLGELSDGSYGGEILSPDGTISSEILPLSSDFQLGGGDTSSQSPVTGASLGITSPSVNAFIGSSQDAMVTVCASVYGPAGAYGRVYLTIDGAVVEPEIIAANGGSFSQSFSLKKWMQANLHPLVTPNADHIFSLEYSSTYPGDTFAFSNLSLIVQPA